MSKGWRNEPGRHSLASKGIETSRNYFSRMKDDGEIEAIIESTSENMYYHTSNLMRGAPDKSNRFEILFKTVPGNVEPSGIVYDIDNNKISGYVRFPVVRSRDLREEIKEKVDKYLPEGAELDVIDKRKDGKWKLSRIHILLDSEPIEPHRIEDFIGRLSRMIDDIMEEFYEQRLV